MTREDPQLKIRLSQELKEFIEEQAKFNHRTLNAEIVFRLEQSKSPLTQSSQAEVKVIDLKNGYRRLIFGKYINILGLDYTQNLTDLKKDIDLSLSALSRSSFKNRLSFLTKEVYVHQGGSHIDVVDNGKGSLGWLRIEDHYVSEN